MFSKRLSAAALATLMTVSISACSRDESATLSAPDAYARAASGELTLIDIRRPDEWRQTGVAQGALQVNMVHPQGVPGFLDQIMVKLAGRQDTPIGLICRTGNRTTHMQKALREAGFTQVYNIREGMVGSSAGPGWLARGLPVESCKSC